MNWLLVLFAAPTVPPRKQQIAPMVAEIGEVDVNVEQPRRAARSSKKLDSCQWIFGNGRISSMPKKWSPSYSQINPRAQHPQ